MTNSIATPLMERTVCTECGHMHREVLGKPQRDSRGRNLPVKCECCAADIQANEPEEVAS